VVKARKGEIQQYADAEKVKLGEASNAEATRVDTAYDDAIAAVDTNLTGARNQITERRDAKIQSSREAAESGLRNLYQTITAKQQALHTAAGEKATAATTFGNDEAQRATNSSRVQAADAVATGGRKAAELASHDRGDLSGREAREMAGKLSSKILASGDDLAATARKDAGDLAAKFPKEAEDGAAKFVEARGDAQKKIEEARDAAIRDITELAKEPVSRLEKQAGDLQQQLQSQRQDAAKQLRASADVGMRGLDRAAQTATQKVDEEGTKGSHQLDDATVQLAARLNGVNRRDAQRVLTRAEGDLTAAVEKFDADMGKFATDTKTSFETGVAEVGAQVSAQATQLVAPVNNAATQFSTTAKQAASETTASIDERAIKASTDIDEVVKKVDAELQKAVDESKKEWDDQFNKGKPEIKAKVDKGLSEQQAQVTALPGKIDERAKEIEEESWLSRGLKWLGGAVVGLLKALGTALLVILAIVIVVLVVVAIVLAIAYAIGGLAGVLAVILFIAAVAEALAGVAALILELVTVYFVLRALWLMYKSFTAEGLTDFERGEMFGEATFDIVAVLFGEEIVKWLGEWFKGAEVAAEADELAELRKLVPDETLLNRLLKSVGGDAKELKALLGLLGNDGAKLEELLALTGNDAAKLKRLLAYPSINGAKLEELLTKAGGDSDRLLALLEANNGDIARVEQELEGVTPPEKPPNSEGSVQPPVSYDPSVRTDPELQLDRDPAPRLGETPEQAAERARAAESEIELRRAMGVYNALGDAPPRINLAENDAAHAGEGAHSLERHGPDVPLTRGDAAPGGRSIQGRIYGDSPWGRAENWSYRWADESTMSRTINSYIRTNWENIRSQLSLTGEFEETFNAGNAIGDGFFNEGMFGSGPRNAVFQRTSYVTLRLRMVPGSTPPTFFVVTAFPSGMP
jgi:hypothetical protein